MPHRRSIRLPDYNYSQNGAYFVTICTRDRAEIFGEIRRNGSSSITQEIYTWEPTEFGKIAEKYWYEIPEHYPNVELDAFTIMPNHIHGIICITGTVGAQYLVPRVQNIEPLRKHAFQKTTSGSLGSIMRGYKIGVTKGCRELHKNGILVEDRGLSEGRRFSAPTDTKLIIWQSNFYEHVIRDEKDLNRVREYIENNPVQWSEDEMNTGP